MGRVSSRRAAGLIPLPIQFPQVFMERLANLKRLGFFTRLLDDAAPAERYRLAAAQIAHAETAGLDSAWIAQHHFHEGEGGLPAPFAFLGFVAAQTSCIRLGTGIVTLPLENPVRVAEDAAVLDLLSNGRFELGVGTGGNPSAFAAFGLDSAQRAEIFADNLDIVRNALRPRRFPAAIRSIRRGRNCATGSGRRRFP
jgi:alkanesulfonate monooxygenase SsuD/methylene tetrahydromethanopterin reductase-like flavin-dependent oxidoreductase (luciferase family)